MNDGHLDTFISSALKELGHEPFLILPEKRYEYLRTIMLDIIRLKKNSPEEIAKRFDKHAAWVKEDAEYKAPELWKDCLEKRWITFLRRAIVGD